VLLSYLAGFVFDPLWVALILLAASFAFRRTRPELARWLPLVAAGLLWVFALPITANDLAHALEAPVEPRIKDGVTYDAVIVLGGTMEAATTFDTGEPQYDESAERVLAGFDLLRTNKAKYAIISGTSWRASKRGPPPESRIIKDQLVKWGIDPERIVVDEESRNTHENAIESVRIAKEHGWLTDVLVTSAAHMKRARGCFSKEGLEVDTRQVDYVAYDPDKHRHGWAPRSVTLRDSTLALREHVARLAYKLRGWTN
jgi:uncharacterized SAM-binding protein YcdF (DUF218 family)